MELATVETHVVDGGLKVVVAGEIDISNALPLERRVLGAVASHRSVVLDLAEVTYMDSSGTRLLHNVHKDLVRRACRLQIVAPPGSHIRRIMSITGLDQIIDVARAGAQDS